MNYKLINTWLDEHDITLEQSFADALKALATAYKKSIGAI